MDTSNQGTQTTASSPTKRIASGGLAVIGFVALILIGIVTAIYAATFLPKAFSGLSSANVYLSSLDQSGQPNQLQAVNGNTTGTQVPQTSIALSPATTTSGTIVGSATPTTTTTPTVPTPTTPTYTAPTYHTVVVPQAQSYYGQPDLVTTITSVGYLTTAGNTSSFVANTTVPAGEQGAVRFVVANRGTNVSGTWNFEANLPTGDSSSDYRSAYQQSLNPGDSIVYTLGFDSSLSGTQTISITADPNNSVSESNENNNTTSSTISLNGNYGYNNCGSTYNIYTSNCGSGNGSSNYDSSGNYCTYGTYYSGGRYYCNTSYQNGNGSSQYDSNGNYCQYGTYYSNSQYYCNSSNNNNSNNGSSNYDSNGNYCSQGTYYSNSRYYCNGSSNTYSNGQYDSNGNYCQYGTYYSNSRYYCNSSNSNSNSGGNYASNGQYCSYGTYYSNGQYYCNASNTNNNGGNYDSNGDYCSLGTYYYNGRYYCD